MNLEAMERWLAHAAQRLGQMGAERVFLFGSWARGTATRRSDVDLLVIWATDVAPLERIGRVLAALKDAPVPVEPLVYTPAEFAARSELPFLRRVLREARVLYERGEATAGSTTLASPGRG